MIPLCISTTHLTDLYENGPIHNTMPLLYYVNKGIHTKSTKQFCIQLYSYINKLIRCPVFYLTL